MKLIDKYNDSTIQRSKAESILFNILDEMSNRVGVLDIRNIDSDIQDEMLESWIDIINKEL